LRYQRRLLVGTRPVPWLKLLHITAVIVWCGALLYLPAAIAAAAGRPASAQAAPMPLRLLFTGLATPAALIAIISGTTIFLLSGPIAPWLIVKLAVVSLLVLGHAACGWLVLRSEKGPGSHLRVACAGIGVLSMTWLGTIAWLVLHKPF